MAAVVFQVLRVEVSAFRGVKGSLEFDFTQDSGVSLITGENQVEPELEANGTGKSTLPESIEWCLFGKTSVGASGPRVEPWGDIRAPTTVRTTVAVNSRQYEVERSRNPNSLSLTPVGGQPRVVDQEALEEALGFGHDEFSACVHLSQTGAQFLDLKPAEQSLKLSKILDLDRWADTAKDIAKDASNFAKQIHELEQVRSRLQGQHEALTEQESALSDREDEWRNQQAARQETRNANLLEAQQRLKKAKRSAAVYAKQIPQVEAEIAAFSETLEKHRQRISEMRAKQRMYREQLRSKHPGDEPHTKCHACDRPFEDAEQVEANFQKALAESEKLVEKVRKWRERADALEARCPSDGGLSEKLRELRDNRSRMESQVFRAQAECERLSTWEGDPNPYEEELESIGTRLDAIEAKFEKVRERLSGLEELRAMADYWAKALMRLRLWRLNNGVKEFERFISYHMAQLGLPNWRVLIKTEQELQSGETRAKLTLLVVPQGSDEPRNIKDFSGGEAQRLRNAICAGFADFTAARSGLDSRIEFWDEPTQHLSSRGCDDLTLWMVDRAASSKKRIMLIDHRMLVSGAFDERWVFRKNEAGIFVDQSK